MPLVRIDLRRGKSSEYKKAICDGVYQALREIFTVPENDRFMVVTDRDDADFVHSQTYLGIEYSTETASRNTSKQSAESALPALRRLEPLGAKHRDGFRRAQHPEQRFHGSSLAATRHESADKYRDHIQFVWEQTNDLGAGDVHEFRLLLNGDVGVTAEQQIAGKTAGWRMSGLGVDNGGDAQPLNQLAEINAARSPRRRIGVSDAFGVEQRLNEGF
jgi:phenylpyruvate tautomerase PptA (4-oxalocrotonate tautomerase family)